MLTLSQITEQYAEALRPFKRNILREYLQYKILEIMFASEYATKLSFLGGTALRIVYGNTRFSEDVDFDNFGLKEDEFDGIAEKVRLGLDALGLKTEIDTVSKGGYRCRVRLPEILFVNELSPHQEEKILIQIDTVAHEYAYKPDEKILNKFDVFSKIFVTPPSILLSQKFFAAINRKRAKGRDFYDIIFLLSFAKPDYVYLAQKIGASTSNELRGKVLEMAKGLDFQALAQDVSPFLFIPSDAKKVELFPQFIAQANLG
ncbi:MAG: hypothetical protein UW70_C0066G0003 [Candidatus Peregrinibacteria bacterium GW2011_GWA2_44_7]|nr:MAG: hypothetical protein UW70_C0066G0003 [Candidatus Peregrinibacteria bacterium GW2011_GWA2_44_7]